MNKDAVAEMSQQYQVEAAQKLVPEGYKQTEVGVIPEDWSVSELGDAVEFLDGLRRPVKSSERAKIFGIYPYYGASGIVDYVNDYIFDEELILLGEDGENILSRNLPLAFRVSGKIWVNNHAHVMRPRKEFDIGYLTEFLESLDYSLLNSGTAQPKLNKRSCLGIKVAKPSKKEQAAIANALSDTDALLSELEKLIAKKQAIKTATMQQLLTGRTRLPQFANHPDGSKKGYKQSELGEIPEDWIIAAIADQHEIATGNTPPTSDIRNYGGNYLFVSPADLGNKKCIDKAEKTLSNKGFALARKFPAGSTLFTCIGSTIGKTGYATVDLTSNQQINAVFPNENHDSNFTYYALTYIAPKIKVLAGEQAVPLVNKTAFGQTLYYLPKKKQEQTAIATILSDMDEEIQALEQRLNKTRQIKQGMMQEEL